MSEEIAVVKVETNSEVESAVQQAAIEAVAEEIAEAVAENLEESEDETQWVRDLFREELGSLRQEFQNLQQQILVTLERVPNQETFQTLLNSLTQIVQTKLIAEESTPIQPALVIAEETTAEETPAIPEVSAEAAERAPEIKQQKRRRL